MRILLTTIMIAALAVPATAADVAKIGLVDLQKVLLESKAGKAALAEIDLRRKEMDADLKEKEAEIEQLRQKVERESMVMDPESVEQQRRNIRIKINDIKSLGQRYQREIKKLHDGHVNRIQNEVLKVVDKIGKEQGYLLIIERGVVMYAPKSVDLTDTVIRRYDAEFSK